SRMSNSRHLHGDLYMPGTDHAGLDGSSGAYILDPDLLAKCPAVHCFARHSHINRSVFGSDYDLVALAHDLGQRNLIGGYDLMRLAAARQLVAHGLVELRQITLVEQAHVPFGQGDVGRAEHAVSFERSTRHDDFPIQMHLCGNENRPRRTALATDPYGGSADRLGRAFQSGAQGRVTLGQAQARIQAGYFDFMTALNLATLQIVRDALLKKVVGDVDKLLRACYGCCID